MIQEIAPHHYNNTYITTPPNTDSIALYYDDNKVLMRKRPDLISYPTFKDLERLNDDIYEDYTYLFSIDDIGYYLVHNINIEPTSSFFMDNTESLREANPQYQAFAGITGFQLSKWYSYNRFCGYCGGKTKHHDSLRAVVCESCESIVFPKLSPAIIVGVTSADKLLLTKYANRSFTNYALVAGYVEIGESLEECVMREVFEEVGLTVTNIRYYKSQPWSFSDTVLMGFYCDDTGETPIELDKEELAVATWYKREDIPVEPRRDSLTNEMIIRFKNGQK